MPGIADVYALHQGVVLSRCLPHISIQTLEHSHTAAEWLEEICCTSTGLLEQYRHTHTLNTVAC